MVEGIKRGDVVVTSGGLVGKVTKASDTEVTVELAENVRVQLIKSMVIEVRGKERAGRGQRLEQQPIRGRAEGSPDATISGLEGDIDHPHPSMGCCDGAAEFRQHKRHATAQRRASISGSTFKAGCIF